MKFKSFFIFLFSFLSFVKVSSAHCPLCTIGAGAAAAGAIYFGINTIVVGIFIGAFAIATGLWFNNFLKKKYVPHQEKLLPSFSFVTTIFPILPMMGGYSSIYISWFGGYGTMFNRTYLINLFFVGAIIGALIMLITPSISKKLSSIRNKTIPFQGIMITFFMLLFTSVIAQVIL